MKVILNQDVLSLGELGDVKDVAPGYARNYLLPRGLALPHNAKTVAIFAKREAEIVAAKEEKRKASLGLKEKLEAEDVTLTMPAGANGKLFGAVTNQTIADELARKGIQVDRKKIDIPDRQLKSAGNYKVTVHLYEKDEATLKVVVIGQDTHKKQEAAPAEKRPRRRDAEQAQEAPAEEASED